MNKTNIVNNAHKRMSTEARNKLPLSVAYEFFSNCLLEIIDQVANGNNVTLTGFGRFKDFLRQSRKGVHPKNSSVGIELCEKIVPKFYASPIFKKKVEEKAIKSKKLLKG